MRIPCSQSTVQFPFNGILKPRCRVECAHEPWVLRGAVRGVKPEVGLASVWHSTLRSDASFSAPAAQLRFKASPDRIALGYDFDGGRCDAGVEGGEFHASAGRGPPALPEVAIAARVAGCNPNGSPGSLSATIGGTGRSPEKPLQRPGRSRRAFHSHEISQGRPDLLSRDGPPNVLG